MYNFCCSLVIQLSIAHQQGDRFCLCLWTQHTGGLKRMPDQLLLLSVPASHFLAGGSQRISPLRISPLGMTLATASGTCSYRAERGPWHHGTAGAAPQTSVATRHGSWDRGGQHTPGEGAGRLGQLVWCLAVSLQVDITCVLEVVRAR